MALKRSIQSGQKTGLQTLSALRDLETKIRGCLIEIARQLKYVSLVIASGMG
jgi:hypothetical protein